MIITRLHGRLGNQMFQYAAASGLAMRLDTQVALDPRNALNRGEGVLTDVFDLPVAEAAALPPTRHLAPLRYQMWRLTGQRPVFRREKGLGFNQGINSWGEDSYLHGYWQSEQYFAHIAVDIRRAFRFPDFSTRQNAEMAGRIGQGVSVSLHVRRGDYLTLGAHVLCDQGYYEAALRAVLDGVEGAPTVYVFSDDPTWAKENLPLPCNKVVVDFNGTGADYEDMRLMSLCQHNIIANSSFSWWAAWLNAHSAKRVAGPANWFGDPKLSNPDILPDEWLKIRV
jgi:hypothetical protein